MDDTRAVPEESLEEPDRLAAADHDLFKRLAYWVAERRMCPPAILFLEAHRPLSFIGATALIMASPIVSFFEPFFRGLLGKGFTYDDYRRFAELMENRENVEDLIVAVERAHQDVRTRMKEEKVKRKALKQEARQKKKELRRARRAASDRGDS